MRYEAVVGSEVKQDVNVCWYEAPEEKKPEKPIGPGNGKDDGKDGGKDKPQFGRGPCDEGSVFIPDDDKVKVSAGNCWWISTTTNPCVPPTNDG